MSSTAPATPDDADAQLELAELLSRLSSQPEREPVASELEVLHSIYDEHAIRVWHPPEGAAPAAPDTIRYEVSLSLPPPYDAVPLRILVSLPPAYPGSAPPQLQLLSRYVGAFGVDAALFGAVLRTFISKDGVEWTPDNVCVFDGIQSVLDRCAAWYEARLSHDAAEQLAREEDRDAPEQLLRDAGAESDEREQVASAASVASVALPEGVEIFEAEPIVDRKSAFVGRACRISSPADVPLVLAHLLADRRIARAAHPVINAWRCRAGNVLHQDNDDDGETAAGGRLAHLLQILDVPDVLVIVTRYFGGIHLGPDRFKHINQAARNALDVGGFLDDPSNAQVDGRRGAARTKKR